MFGDVWRVCCITNALKYVSILNLLQDEVLYNFHFAPVSIMSHLMESCPKFGRLLKNLSYLTNLPHLLQYTIDTPFAINPVVQITATAAQSELHKPVGDIAQAALLFFKLSRLLFYIIQAVMLKNPLLKSRDIYQYTAQQYKPNGDRQLNIL